MQRAVSGQRVQRRRVLALQPGCLCHMLPCRHSAAAMLTNLQVICVSLRPADVPNTVLQYDNKPAEAQSDQRGPQHMPF